MAGLLPVAQGDPGRSDAERGHERYGLRAEHAHGEEEKEREAEHAA